MLAMRLTLPAMAAGVLLIAQAGVAHGQQAVADSLWRLGRRAEAIDEYRNVIAADPTAVHANLRIAQDLASRDADSAVVFVRNARARVPEDPDLLFAEATYLSWARRFDDAIVRYDSLLAGNPDLDYVRVAHARVLSWKGELAAAALGYQQVIDRAGPDRAARRDAAFGLAQVSAWQGNRAEAARRYEALLADDPAEVRALVGLAAVRSAQGRPIAARALLDRAIEHDRADSDALQLRAVVERALRPALEVTASWSHDSDQNRASWQQATQSFVVADGVRASVTAGFQQASDRYRRTNRALGEVGGSASRGPLTVAAGLGARQLDAATGPPGETGERTEFTWRGSAALRPRPNVGVGVAAWRAPFDEIAALLARRLTLTNVEATADWSPGAGTALLLSGGVMAFSDGNRRTSALLRVSRREPGAITIGAVARTFSFDQTGDGYFTPRQFVLGDAYASWEHTTARWAIGVSGGGGVQRLGPGDPTQGQWHLDARIGRRLAHGAAIDAFAGTSTSAAASAAGAFRYETFGVSARLPF